MTIVADRAPTDWVTTSITASKQVLNQFFEQRKIVKIKGMPLGKILNICADPVPAGWQLVSNIPNCGRVINTFYSGYVIKKITAPLPLRLVSFHVVSESINTTLLNWDTADELNTNLFRIERSFDAKSFSTIGEVPAAGTGNQTYNYVDRKELGRLTTYYRLKMIDKDDSFTYSSIRSVSFKQHQSLRLRPNPAEKVLVFDGDESILGTKIMLFDNTGKKLNEFNINTEGQEMDVSKLKPGLYILRLHDGLGLKFIKK